MKLKLLILVTLGLMMVWFNLGWGQCPEDTVDRGLCDSLFIKVLYHDDIFDGPGDSVRVAIYVTHDLLSAVDSIGSFVIPLHFTHTNPTQYCSLSSYWNTKDLSGAGLSRSVFRHLVHPGTGDTIYNRMLKLAEQNMGLEWNVRIVRVMTDQTNPDNNWFKLTLFPASYSNQWWWAGERVLLATMTFKIQDTMTICIDTVFWPPNSHLSFWRRDSKGYTPRSNLPACFRIDWLHPMCCEWCGVAGDANWDGIAELTDVIYVMEYLFMGGSPPLYCDCADVNCDGVINIADLVYYINYWFIDGPRLRSCTGCY